MMGTKKGPVGTPSNPRKISYPTWDFEIPDGVSETYVVEYKESKKAKWVPYEDENTFSSKKRALDALKYLENEARESHVYQMEAEWRQKNMHNQQSVQLVQFRITKNTTNAEVDALVKQIEDHKKRLKGNPPAKMPDFTKEPLPEYPKFRVSRRTISIDSEVIENGKGK